METADFTKLNLANQVSAQIRTEIHLRPLLGLGSNVIVLCTHQTVLTEYLIP